MPNGPTPAPAENTGADGTNLAAIFDALGFGPDRVVELTVFVVDHDMSKLDTRNNSADFRQVDAG